MLPVVNRYLSFSEIPKDFCHCQKKGFNIDKAGKKSPESGLSLRREKQHTTGDPLKKRPVTLNYVIFYILFLPDTWRILMGIIISALITPHVTTPNLGVSGRIMLYLMIATIGYAGTAIPGRWVSEMFKKLILGDKRPR
ncbi:MAG: hypothetical protein COX19_06195 [Desulfobacterales bacterium CG23_combo_of_CG06-09_8_20_14_all_51_8]|nr:MAG: hypothetical protein COX19_06195 [Desulfobacterales bacterium CG23_combo_of_CG06-09_8_20_14_all_51_8]